MASCVHQTLTLADNTFLKLCQSLIYIKQLTSSLNFPFDILQSPLTSLGLASNCTGLCSGEALGLNCRIVSKLVVLPHHSRVHRLGCFPISTLVHRHDHRSAETKVMLQSI